ncbi:MAG: murein biosynthesis integral membrane protein MurJ, partial [Acidobacteriota bacterium]
YVREITQSYFFVVVAHADEFPNELRGPNQLQKLLGEQSLSASFIPIYSRMLEERRYEEAGRFAGAIFGLLLALAGVVSLVGVALAPAVVTIVAPGYLGDAKEVAEGTLSIDRFPLAVAAVRIMFPMAGILVLSAWALGILNSHRRFFIPYMAPALWNASIIAALVFTARNVGGFAAAPDVSTLDTLLISGCVGALIGGVLQFAVQLPFVFRSLVSFKVAISFRVPGVRQAIAAFAPLVAGRGAVQLSSYLDLFMASFLMAGALAALGYAQILYLLPIGLFGLSVAAAELPELSRSIGKQTPQDHVERLQRALAQVGFLTVPTAIGYVLLGFLLIAALFRRGSFGLSDNWLVYLVLCAYSLGLVASASSRLLNNVFFAQSRTGIPARIGVERVLLSAALGAGLMFLLDQYSVADVLRLSLEGDDSLHLGAVGLAFGAGVAAWYELWRLKASLRDSMGESIIPWRRFGAMTLLSLAAGSLALGAWLALGKRLPTMVVILVLAIYASVYLLGARLMGWPELSQWTRSGRFFGGGALK